MIGMRLAILGGGPAGYAAAATAAYLGAEVTLIEDNQLGGNCTMTDAIPSKTLLTTADAMLKISQAEEEGVDFARGFPEVNLRRTLARARAVALHQSRGVRERMDGMNVRVLPGRGVVTAPGQHAHVHAVHALPHAAALVECDGTGAGQRPAKVDLGESAGEVDAL